MENGGDAGGRGGTRSLKEAMKGAGGASSVVWLADLAYAAILPEGGEISAVLRQVYRGAVRLWGG